MSSIRDALIAALDERPDDAVASLVAQGVPREVAERSLADIPRKVELYGELVDDDWLLRVFTGRVLTLGRLQFERDPGVHGRNIHIPETGRLDPVAVDASLSWAERYFLDGAPMVCESWMLDPALRQLPATANMRRFADRFDITPAPRTVSGARSLAKFVFRARPEDVLACELPRDASTIERIAYGALSGDGLWSEPIGVLRSRGSQEEGAVHRHPSSPTTAPTRTALPRTS